MCWNGVDMKGILKDFMLCCQQCSALFLRFLTSAVRGLCCIQVRLTPRSSLPSLLSLPSSLAHSSLP